MPEEQAAFMRVAVTGVPGIESAPQLRTKHYICVDIESWPAIMKQSRPNINEGKLYGENDKPPDQDGKQYKEKYFDVKKYFKFSFHYTSGELVR